MDNPLLENHALPPFSAIDATHVVPAIRALIDDCRATIDRALSAEQGFLWDSVLAPIEAAEDRLARAWSPVSHLNSVMNNPSLREAYNACLPMLTEYHTWRDQHDGLRGAYQAIAEDPESKKLGAAQRKTLENGLRDFHLSGVALPAAHKERYRELRKSLSELTSKFSENVLDATNAWSKGVPGDDLAGLPDTAMASARQAAERAGIEGYLLNLELPSVMPVLTYCENRTLREEIYTANVTRASECGPHAGQWDNTALIEKIMDLRTEQAKLLGFGSYAEFSLATKMADGTAQVLEFLQSLARKSLAQARREWQELQAFARREDGLEDLKAWDVNYYSERLRQERYQLSQEEIRPFLPVDRVLQGLFDVVQRLYDVNVAEVNDFDTYHDDVKLFNLQQGGRTIARFYLDLYARANKRGGAWMDDCRIRRYNGDKLQLPVAYMVCNFTPPVGDTPALLTHVDLTTLFHEFGHGLHHMLTQQSVAAVSGINGVAWDAVELPSQLLENWCWEAPALALITGHHKTGEPLPKSLLDRLLASRNFQSAMAMVRQLEFALFDFRLHSEWQLAGVTDVQMLLNEVRSQVAVIPAPDWNRFQHGFTHVFSGGYAAGYYSYKWAEVLSADAFSKFEEDGIFNSDTAASFRTSVLESGGAREAMDCFVEFRGRKPSVEPLLRHSGILA
ncbi:MAG: M3 family metallopeptidase [Pseudomonadota bacterium]